MKITKFGHSCLLVEENGMRLLMDPGSWSVLPENLGPLDAIIITHEHQDHYTPEILKKLLDQHKDAQIITNSGVGARLSEAGIAYQVIEDGQGIKIGGVVIEGHGSEHALIHADWPRCHNTGYFIAGKLFHPGDSHEIFPQQSVEILALPVAAPWGTIGGATEYAKALKPKKCFPIHDANLKWPGVFHTLPHKLLEQSNIQFMVLDEGKEYSF